jgi:hypothetical protein
LNMMELNMKLYGRTQTNYSEDLILSEEKQE